MRGIFINTSHFFCIKISFIKNNKIKGDSMCTAITYKSNSFYFGRNLDLEYSYNETVTITPRNFTLNFTDNSLMSSHYAMIGMAYVVNDYPLYYDATNEMGLSMAGLSFSGNAVYRPVDSSKKNVSPYEFIPWVLCQCKSVEESKKLLENINLSDVRFSDELPLTDLHWIIADRVSSIVVESVESGLCIYDNPVGVLTNNPPFKYHLNNLNNFMSLSSEEPRNNFSYKHDFYVYSRGMGALGLPGDLSSMSRFVRAAFVKLNSVSDGTGADDVSQFFHILSAVEQQRGCVKVGKRYEITVYSSCCDTKMGIYYYKTYNNSKINAVQMYKENLNGDELISYSLVNEEQIYFHN